MSPWIRALLATLLPLGLAGCAMPRWPGGVEPAPPQPLAEIAPARWQAPLPPLPHAGSLTELTRWWQQLGDPVLLALITAAQEVSPVPASALARIQQARAARVAAGAALGPTVDAAASASRGFSEQYGRVATTAQAGLQASWEADLFGGNAAARDAAQARYEGAQAEWHDARVSVAAEVAQVYFSLRSCERLLAVARFDARSRAESARLTEQLSQAGFQPPAASALARASRAEGAARATQQAALCDLDVKALVALAAMDETRLRERLAEAPASMGRPPDLAIATVPAVLLAQRPDVFGAERELLAARADIGQAQAQHYPRLGLSGAIGAGTVRMGGVGTDAVTWSIGPVSLSLPVYDGGRRTAQVEAAQARYEQAAVVYRARARQAVLEVEDALVRLGSVAGRNDDALAAAEGYKQAFNATEQRYRSGMASLMELEESRRYALSAETALVGLQRERMAAWVGLYRATGGGWTRETPGPRWEPPQARR